MLGPRTIAALLAAVAGIAPAAAQEVPIHGDLASVLDTMSRDVSAEVARCGTKVEFLIPRGKKKVGDAVAVIDPAATPAQIACAKGVISWLVSDEEARARGYK